jgi:nucleoid-associated protein YgaU
MWKCSRQPNQLPLKEKNLTVRQHDELPCVHIVQEGDTLYEIAQAYYGVGDMWERIAQAQGNLTPDGSPLNPDTLQVGQRIVIPGGWRIPKA